MQNERGHVGGEAGRQGEDIGEFGSCLPRWNQVSIEQLKLRQHGLVPFPDNLCQVARRNATS